MAYTLRSRVVPIAKSAATGVAGGVLGLVAGTAAGIKQPELTQKFVTNIPRMLSQNWKESQILRYITDQIANSSQLNKKLLHSVIIKLLYTPDVLNKSERDQYNYGKNLGKNLSRLYNKYKKVPVTGDPSRYAKMKSGVFNGALPKVSKTVKVVGTVGKIAGTPFKLVGGALGRVIPRPKNKSSKNSRSRRSSPR